MKKFSMQVNKRHDLGKGASRRLRRRDLVPGIVYGGDVDPLNVEVGHKELTLLLEDPAVASSMIELTCDGQNQLVVIRDLQRHPYKSRIMHFDLQRIDRNKPIVMRVPLRFVNGEIAPGVKIDGGLISHLITTVEISCLPEQLPDHIDVDLSELGLNQAIHLSQLALPQGVELVGGHHDERDMVVVTIHLPKGSEESESVAPESAEVPVVAKGKEATEE